MEIHNMFILICGVCVILLFMLLNWLIDQPDNAIYIKFNSFISFYNINPDRWRLNDDSVDFVKEKFYCSSDYIYYKFHFIDFYRYKHWHKKLIKQKKLQKEMNDIFNHNLKGITSEEEKYKQNSTNENLDNHKRNNIDIHEIP